MLVKDYKWIWNDEKEVMHAFPIIRKVGNKRKKRLVYLLIWNPILKEIK